MLSSIRMFAVPLLLAMTVTACMKPSTRSADPNDEVKSQASATFIIPGEVKGESMVSKNMLGFSIPTEKLFTFTACLQDKRTNEPIKGAKFDVVGGKDIKVDGEGRTTSGGCLNWSEKIAFNGLSDGKFILLKRTITSAPKTMHTGSRDLLICINPWDSTSAVRDCEKHPVPTEQMVEQADSDNYLKGQSKAGQNITRNFWVDDLRISAVHDPGGGEPGMLDFNVAFVPKVLRKNVRGDDDPVALTNGTFTGQFWVVAKTGTGEQGKQCIVIAKSQIDKGQGDMTMVAGRLKDELKLKVRYLSTYGQLELYGVIQPKEATTELHPYNGVWLLGDHTSLLGMKFGFERPLTYKGDIGSFSAKNYVESNCIDVSDGALLEKSSAAVLTPEQIAAAKEPVKIALDTHLVDGKAVPLQAQVPKDLMEESCVEGGDIPRLFPKDAVAQSFRPGADFLSCVNKNLPSGITRLEPFEFSKAFVKVQPISDPMNTETTNERTIKYQVILKVTNPLAQGAPLRDIEFDIERSDGTIYKNVRTDHAGDLIFVDQVHHDYFVPERYILKTVRIRHSSGFTKRLALVFNPWDNNGFSFATDIRGMTKKMIAQVNLVPRPKSELLITQFQWGTQNFRYEVDQFLNLKIFKTFNLTLNPRVLRYSSLMEGRNKDEPLRPGIYLMKVAIQKDYKKMDGEPLEYITAVRKLVRVQNGVINTPVEMAFRDFRILKLRSNLMIELATIDEKKLSQEQRRKVDYPGSLESLVDHNSGLSPRTFIGPVVAYSNGFSASMRPADDLSESVCQTIDCDELKRKAICVDDCKEPVAKEMPSDWVTAGTANLGATASKAVVDSEQWTRAQRAQELAENRPSLLARALAAGTKTKPPVSASELAKQVSLGKQFFGDSTEPGKPALNDQGKPAKNDKEKFVGSIEHLGNKTVSDMIQRMFVIEKKYNEGMRESARLARLLYKGNMEYAPAVNEVAIISQDKYLPKNNQILKAGNAYNDLLTRMSSIRPTAHFSNDESFANRAMIYQQITRSRNVDQKSFRDVMFGGKPMTQDLAARLCVVFLEDVVARVSTREKEGPWDSLMSFNKRLSLNDKCLQQVLSINSGGVQNSPIVKEQMLRVFEITDKAERREGSLMSLGVGASSSFGMGHGESMSYGWSPSKTLEGIAKVFKIGELLLDTVGASFSMSRSESKSAGEDTGVGVNQNLAVEMRAMRVGLERYERCSALHLSQEFIEANFEDIRETMTYSISLQSKFDRMRRGIFVCEGVVSTMPLVADERYYQFSQGMGEEVMNDPTSLENHPYLISNIRGRSDFTRTVRAIEARPATLKELPDHFNIGEIAIERLTTALNAVTPTFPGVLTVLPETIVNPNRENEAGRNCIQYQKGSSQPVKCANTQDGDMYDFKSPIRR